MEITTDKKRQIIVGLQLIRHTKYKECSFSDYWDKSDPK